MLLTADWALPVSGPPILHGAVVVRGTRLQEVGPAGVLRRAHPGLHEYPFPGCVLTPGLVNAHTHLSLTAFEGLLPSAPFPEWVSRLAAAMRELGTEDLADSAAMGALQCLRSGVTVVGDVAYGPDAPASAADLGLGGAFYWELFGIPAERIDERLAETEYPSAEECAGPRVECGLSAHSMYTSGPKLLQSVWRKARLTGRPTMLHVAESPAEARLAAMGEGPLQAVAARLADGFQAPRTSPVKYLTRLGVLTDTLAVHCVQVSPGDAERLAAHARGVVLCPTSNEYLRCGAPPVALLRSAGARLAVGTDSPASAPGADVLGEVRRLASMDPGLTAERCLRMLTMEGAEALGLDDRFGTLQAGRQADVAVFRVGPADDPVGAVVHGGSPASLEALLSAGVWRVLEGKPSSHTTPIERAFGRIRERAEAAVL